jgi:hypothetical protein
VDIQVQAYYPMDSINNVFIEGYCTNNAIVASCDIDLNGYFTAVPANVILGGQQNPGPSTPAPTPTEVTGATVERPKHGATQIIVQLNGTLDQGTGLLLSDFHLTTIAKGKNHAKTIPLARAAYDPTTDAVVLTPRRKLNLNSPLKLTISGLTAAPSTLILTKHGTTVAAARTGQVQANIARPMLPANTASLSADTVDAVFTESP